MSRLDAFREEFDKIGPDDEFDIECPHERLNEEGYCRRCGADCRGIHQ